MGRKSKININAFTSSRIYKRYTQLMIETKKNLKFACVKIRQLTIFVFVVFFVALLFQQQQNIIIITN